MAKSEKTVQYDDAKRYSVVLSRVVEYEGFTLKPGPNPVEMSGEWVNLHSDSVESATELEPARELPPAVEQKHETA